MTTDAIQDLWVDRDLGWLEFNRRVLAEAQDARTPLLERLKFLAIFTSNLVAPWSMRDRFLGLIEREREHHKAGRPASWRLLSSRLGLLRA